MERKNSVKCALLLFALLALLSGCDNQASDIEAITLEHSSDGFTRISLRAGSTQAAVSGNLGGRMYYGETVTLSAAPFIQDGVFYFPLEDVVPLLGGTCEIEGDTARVHVYERDLCFRAGSPNVTIDGTAYQNYSGEARMPQILDGVFYLPQGFEVSGEPTGLEGPELWLDLDREQLILSRSTAVNCELCAAGAWLEEPFDNVPASVRRTLKSAGQDPMNPQCYAERYEGDGVTIWVERPIDEAEMEGIDTGFVVCIKITGDKYPTWRGLRVGDSRERAELLYGDLGPDSYLFPAFPFVVEFDETDHVSAIKLNSHLFGCA